MKIPEFNTVRLVRKTDMEAYHQLIDHNRRNLSAFFKETMACTTSRADTITFLAFCHQEAESRRQYLFVIEEHLTGRLVGSVEVKKIDHKSRKAEIGFFIHSTASKKKMLVTAVGEVVGFAFLSLKLDKLLYQAQIKDKIGRRVAERNGFCAMQGSAGHPDRYGLVNPAIQ